MLQDNAKLSMQSVILYVTFALALSGLGRSACSDPGANRCLTDSTLQCTNANSRITFTDGTIIGLPQSNYTLDDLTTGCYCQYAFSHSYGPTAAANITWATSCNAALTVWWDGESATTTTGGSIPSEKEIACATEMASDSTDAPNSVAPISVVHWPTASQAHIEAPWPSNVAAFDSGLCPGYDVQKGFYPNSKTAPTLAADNVINCTCRTGGYASLGDGAGEPLYGNSFATICDNKTSIYWNGEGYRYLRPSINAGDAAYGDECYQYSPFDSAVDLVYVRSTISGQHGSSAQAENGTAAMMISRLYVAAIAALVLLSLLT